MIKAARRIVEKLRLHGYEAFFAGGWVRDFLLRRKPKDVDIATSASPDEVLRLFPRSIPIGAQFGVIQVRLYGRAFDVVTFREDSNYLDGRHPSSVHFSSPEQDALRRDFTINGLFYDPVADRLIDYVHGRNDIQSKVIRTIGDAVERFTEDKLRMLRAIRFGCNLGFAIAPDTWSALKELAPRILQVSWERIRDELAKLFTGPAPGKGLDLLHESGLLGYILPEVEAMQATPQSSGGIPAVDVFAHTRAMLDRLQKPSAVLAFATLLQDVGKGSAGACESGQKPEGHAALGARISRDICRRLRMSNEEIDRIADLVLMHTDLLRIEEMRESARRRLLCRPYIEDHLELLRVNCLSRRKTLDSYWNCVRKVKDQKQIPATAPLINGDDLIKLGYTPGPIFNRILQTVEDLQFENELRTKEEALAHVKVTFPLSGETPP
jgi:poly(A) polymerase